MGAGSQKGQDGGDVVVSSDDDDSSSSDESERGGIATGNVAVGTGVKTGPEVLACYITGCTRNSDKAEIV